MVGNKEAGRPTPTKREREPTGSTGFNATALGGPFSFSFRVQLLDDDQLFLVAFPPKHFVGGVVDNSIMLRAMPFEIVIYYNEVCAL
jgi:hypothetical protein